MENAIFMRSFVILRQFKRNIDSWMEPFYYSRNWQAHKGN
jgi:hypothetical protein